MIDVPTVQRRIAARPLDYLRELFGEGLKPAGHDRWRVGSRGSLAIALRDGALVFYCHESGTGGDAITLWQRQRGGSMGDALQAAAGWAQVGDDGQTAPQRRSRRRAPQPQPTPPPAPEPMTEAQFQEAHAMSYRLASDDRLCERLASARGWQPETIRYAAFDGALGWSDGLAGRHRGAIAFIYTTGIKLRWRSGDTRIIRWQCGKPAVLWRGDRLIPETRRVYITEGETDALSLLDLSLEEKPDALVVAVPSAGVIPAGMAGQMAGRDVLLCLDNDAAGRAATQKLVAAIGPTAASVKVWRPSR